MVPVIRKKSIITFIALALTTVGVIVFFGARKQASITTESPYDPDSGGPGKKKILIFTSRGGGGNLSASNALQGYLQRDYTVGSVFVFTEILDNLDLFQLASDKEYTGEDLYNYMIKRKWNRLLNRYLDLGSWFYGAFGQAATQAIEEYLTKYKPDLLISVVPLINGIILSVAQKLDIPILLIPTDLDAAIAISNIDAPTYDKFYLAASYDDPEIKKTLEPAHIPDSQISYVGFPIRPEFLKPHNHRHIKSEFNIPQNKPVILLLMGAQGSDELYEFSRQLTKLTIPAHIIIALGKSEELRKSINRIIFPKHVTRSIISFTPRIADLMAISDVLITKSGSVSINEAIYMHLPMLIDATSPVMDWENFNHEFITSRGLGSLIKRSYQIPTLVSKIVSNPQERIAMKKQFSELTKKNPEQEIKILVQKILKNEKYR